MVGVVHDEQHSLTLVPVPRDVDGDRLTVTMACSGDRKTKYRYRGFDGLSGVVGPPTRPRGASPSLAGQTSRCGPGLPSGTSVPRTPAGPQSRRSVLPT